MKKIYKLCTGVVCILLLFSVGFSILKRSDNSNNERFTELHKEKTTDNYDEQLINDDYTVNESFTSHLPLVVVDLEDNIIPDEYEYNSQNDSFEIKDGMDPYIQASIKVINNEDGTNNLLDDAELSSKIKIRHRGNTSVLYEKKQYGIKLLTDENEENELSVMGMEADEDWILNISMSDPSLIRNYLALNISGEIMNYTSDVRYCEVIFKNGDSYEYKGLYLMMENVKKGEGRVNITSYKEGDSYTSYILRRDRFKSDGIMLNTQAALNEQCYGWLEVKYPPSKYIDDSLYNYILNDVDKIEQIVYSDDYDTFKTYSQYIDESSFIDYFILNEFFMNYDAGNNSTYIYKNLGDKLKIGPVWDFDQAVDNYNADLAEVKDIVFAEHPWFERLVKSRTFTRNLAKRYSELREDLLSNENIESKIDSIIEYIGDAQKRDYLRWGHQYATFNSTPLDDSNGITVYRNNTTFEDEIFRLKDTLKLHSIHMENNLINLNHANRYMNYTQAYTGLAILFLVLFFSSVIITRRKYS